ncbi:MAG: ChbG/HpnK family deacetylase [Candidatus Omnitrophota bacterium]
MKSLIINADDVGFSGPINEAVKACCLDGRITGVSVMASGPCFKEAAEMLKEIGKKDVGVHLTLTGNSFPCAGDRSKVSTLVGSDGKFPAGYKTFAFRYFLGKIGAREVRLELSAQIKRVLDEGLVVTHLDSHEHVHMFPEILDLTIRLSKEFGVPYIRFPRESPGIILKRFSVKDFARYASLAVFVSKGKGQITRAGVGRNDAFLGHFHAGRMDEGVFTFLLDRLSDGINEVAVHPSTSSGDFFRECPWYRNAEKEFDFLMNGRWKGRLEAEGIRLVSHKEALESVER